MEQIPGVKWHIEQFNERVVSPSHDHHWNKIDGCHSSSTVSNYSQHFRTSGRVWNKDAARDKVKRDDNQEGDRLETRGEGAKIRGRGDAEFTVVSCAE